jgi:alpha-glucosidase
MKYCLTYSLLFILCTTAFFSAAQTSAGKILSYKKIKGGIAGKTSTGIFEVTTYTPQIIRVRVSNTNEFKPLSYALVSSAVPTNDATIKESGNTIELSTNTITAVIEKQPQFRIIFKNSKGDVINEDASGNGLGISYIGNRFSTYKKLQEGERFIGMGEALGNLDRRGTGIALNNTDTYKYGDPRLSMYSSIPFYMGLHNNVQYGIFYNNSYASFFNFGLSTPQFVSTTFQGGDADYFFMYDASPAKIIEHYTSLTGRMQLPPVWSIGYHQSKCSYMSEQEVEWIASTFRKKQLPLDCIVLDADYQQGYRPFTANKERFPDIAALAATLKAQQIELTASVYPGVAIDSNYHSYKDGLQQKVFLKYADGNYFNTEIAPVQCYLPDYTNPSARQWWKDKMNWLPQNGIHGYWNDMNEPALGGSYIPDNVVFDFDGRKTNALEAKNVYGFQMARSSYEAALQNSMERRPFVLTRSGFAGVQRYAAMWSGDNTASDEGLLGSVLLNNQLGISGLAFSGHDIGGFIGDGNKELYQRWIQVGAFSPFCRNHKGCGGSAGEPWVYGAEAEAISKIFIGFRYRLMPYIYSAFYEASQTGMPIAKSLAVDYPFDDKVYDNKYQYQFLFGQNMLVIPVTSEEKTKKFYLPKGEWYNLYTDKKIVGEKEMTEEIPAYRLPLFVKGSAIIPMQSMVQSTKEQPSDTLFLHIYNGNGQNSFVYYEDAGDGFAYQKGEYCKRIIQLLPNEKKFIITKQEGSFNSKFKKIQLILHGFDEVMAVMHNNTIQALQSTTKHRLQNPLEDLKTVYEENYFKALLGSEKTAAQKIIVIDNSKDQVVIKW